MAGCSIFFPLFFFVFMIVFVKWRFCELLCNLVASDCVHRLHRKGEGGGEGGGREGEVGGGGCLWRMGQAPDQHFPGPVTVPEYSRHVCTVCEHKWQTDLGVCFVSPPFVFCWCSGSSSSYLNTSEHWENTHWRTHTANRMKEFLHCPRPHLHLQFGAGIWGLNTTRQMTAGHFTYSFITSHWFIPVYLFNSWKKVSSGLLFC